MTVQKDIKILSAARGLFLRHGYKRVTMQDIAEAAGISRPALYLVFKNKADIFNATYEQWITDTISRIKTETASLGTIEEKLSLALDLWFVKPFQDASASPEAKEFQECSLPFSRQASIDATARLEETLAALIDTSSRNPEASDGWPAARVARLLSTATRGFYQAAETSDDLSFLVSELLLIAKASKAIA